MYYNDLKFEGLPYFNWNGRDAEEEVRRLFKGGFFLRARIKYRTVKDNVPFEEREVFALAVGNKYLNGLLTEGQVLYYMDKREEGLMAVLLEDLVDIKIQG